LSNFAKVHLSNPPCNLAHMEFCSDKEKDIISSLRQKSTDELEAIDSLVQDQFLVAHESYEAAMAELSEKFNAVAEKYNKEVEAVRDESNHKWVAQILDEQRAKLAGEELQRVLQLLPTLATRLTAPARD
jgi:site-specific DNA-adenine methylase